MRKVAAANMLDFSFGAMKFAVDVCLTFLAYEGAELLSKAIRCYPHSGFAMGRPDLIFKVHATRKFKTSVLSRWLQDLLGIFSSFKVEGKRASVASFFSPEGKVLMQQVCVHAAFLFEYFIKFIPSAETNRGPQVVVTSLKGLEIKSTEAKDH